MGAPRSSASERPARGSACAPADGRGGGQPHWERVGLSCLACCTLHTGPGSSPTVSTVPFNGDLQLVSVLTPLFTCREAAGVIISRHGARVMHSRKAKLCRAPRSAELRALPAFRVLSCQCSRAQSSTLNVPIEAAVEAAATLLVVGSIPLATSKDDELLVGFCGAPILKCAYLSVRGF